MRRKRIFIGVTLMASAVLFFFWFRTQNFKVKLIHPIKVSPERSNTPYQNISNKLRREQYPSLTLPFVDAERVKETRLDKWKAEFPWKPTHDPKLQFDPIRHFSNRALGNKSNTDMETRINHSYLRKFFQSDERFLPQFEKFYRIMAEHDRGHNPVMVGRCFWAFKHYYNAAFEHDAEDYVFENGEKVKKGLFSYLTWGDEVEGYRESLCGYLQHWAWLNPTFKTDKGEADAYSLINRLVSEIDGMELLPINVMSGERILWDEHPDAQELLSGEKELLVPYAGWNEESERYWGEQTRQFEKSYAEGDPSLKAVAPELFPPVGLKEGQLVDKDGDPVQWREGTDIVLVNERGERVPVIIEDDGTISLPSPEDVAVMRENGQVQSADFNDLPPEMAEAILKEKAAESP